jgi:hypothetical protein
MDEDTIANAEAYAVRHRLRLLERLGTGIHGIVFAVEGNAEIGPAALKAHYSSEPYHRERRVYERLNELGVLSEIRGFAGCHGRFALPALRRGSEFASIRVHSRFHFCPRRF